MPSSLRLLESPTITVSGKDYDLLPHKPVCLLVYLAYQGTWVSREILASLFWPEEDEASARHNLRMLLSRAKQLPWAKDLESEATRLRWQVQSDVAAFREAVCQGEWERVATLHRSPLLATWRLTAMPGVEEWLGLEREALLSTWREAVLKHSRTLSQSGNSTSAADFLKTLLAHDPLAEDVLALYLENAYLAGHRDEALKAYETFKVLLGKELDLEPMQETEALAETIRRAETVQNKTSQQGETVKESKVPLTVLRPPSLIGREEEQRLLEASNTSVVLITGEPGVGKSRFLAEVFPSARWLRCREGLENVSYFPLADYVRTNLKNLPTLGPYLADLARLVPEALATTVTTATVTTATVTTAPVTTAPDPQTAKVRLSEALALVLESQATPVIFEDIQWADAATLEFLVFLGVRGKVKLYGSYRSSEVSEGLAATLKSLRGSRLLAEVKLGPLANGRIQELLANLIGIKQGPERFSNWLAARSGGNPFFALETLKNLFETGLLEAKGGNWHSRLDDITQDYSELDVPESISAVIERRLARLSEATRRVLQAASVLRQGFTPKVLSQIVGLSEWGVMEALESAEANNLTYGETFQHDLLRQSIYAELPTVRRKLLHAQIASVLAENADAIIVAEHYFQAGDRDNAVPFYLQAADDDVAKGLHADAKILLEKISKFTSGTNRLELQTRLANICVELGAHTEAEALLETLFNEALTPRLRADALFAKAALLFHQGKLANVAEILVELSELEPNYADFNYNERDRYQLVFLRSQVAFYQNQFAQVKKILTPLLTELRRKTPSQELVKTLTDMGVACDELGEHQEGAKYLQEAMRVTKAIGARHLQVVIAINLLWGGVTSGKVKLVLPEAEEALSLGEYAATMTLRNNLARAYFSLGQDAQAKHHYETITGSSQDPTLLSIAWARLAELYQREKNSSGTKKALDAALNLLSHTEFSVAHISVGTAVAKYGTDTQVKQVMPFLKEHLETEAGQEMNKLLTSRGLTPS
jgi:DNA-binding SARP family transcriptional activator/predicted negative regulator of RcsB-dependent stress response